MILEAGAKRLEGTVEMGFRGAGRTSHRGGRLGDRKLFEVDEDEDLTLGRGQRIERFVDLALKSRVRGSESGRVRGGVAREGVGPLASRGLSSSIVGGLPDEDSIEPGRELRFIAEPTEAAVGAEEGLLRDILGGRFVATDEAPRCADGALAMLRDEGIESFLASRQSGSEGEREEWVDVGSQRVTSGSRKETLRV